MTKAKRDHFINIMKQIRIGSIIAFKEKYKMKNQKIHNGIVEEISPCEITRHEGCKLCVGCIKIKDIKSNQFTSFGECYKKRDSWETRIISVNDGFFIEESDFMME